MCLAYKHKGGIFCVLTIPVVVYLLFPKWKRYSGSRLKLLYSLYTNTLIWNWRSMANKQRDYHLIIWIHCKILINSILLLFLFPPYRKRFKPWASATTPTLCLTTRHSWWRMSCGWSWSCSVVVSACVFQGFLFFNHCTTLDFCLSVWMAWCCTGPNINLNISISFINKRLAVIVKILSIFEHEIQCFLEQHHIWGSRIISRALWNEGGASRKSWATFCR